MGKYPRGVDGRFHPDPARLAEFAETVQKLREERQLAADTVDGLLHETPQDDWPELAEHPDFQTCGALEHLGGLFAASLAGDPLYAMELAQLAVTAAELLPPNLYPPVIDAQVRARAWKDLGKALRFLSRNQQAVNAFARAEAFVLPFGALGHDLAVIRFNLAATLQELERFSESLALLHECKEVFRSHADTTNVVRVAHFEGLLLQRLRKFREAREAYLLLLASTRDMNKESLAALHRSIGFCSIDLADFDDAEANLVHAATLYRELGQTAEVLKVEAGRGRLMIRSGDHRTALSHLRPIRREFLRHAMPEEAGICGLEMVEAMLHLDRAMDAETLARKLVAEFTAASLSTRAITALGYLTEAIAARTASASLAGDVREYILSLQHQPEREFTIR